MDDWNAPKGQLTEEKVAKLLSANATRMAPEIPANLKPHNYANSVPLPTADSRSDVASLWPENPGKSADSIAPQEEDPFNAPRKPRETPAHIAAAYEPVPQMPIAEPAPAPSVFFEHQPASSPAGAQPPKKKLLLGERLIALGLISKDQLHVALQEQKNSKKLIGAILVDMGFITESALAEVIAESSGAERFDPKKSMLDPQAIKLIPKELAMRSKVIPITLENNELRLAMADIYNVIAVDQVRRHVPKGITIIPLYCTDSEIQELIDQYYEYETSVDGILKEIETGIRENTILDGSQDGYVNPTVRLVNALLVDAIKLGVSDIHFEPEGTFLRLRFRIDGQLQQIRSFHRDYWSAIAVRIKIMSGMNIAETRMPQDGRIAFNVLGREVDFRVATHPTIHGENIVMRLLDKTKSLVPLENLGFTEHNISLLKKVIKRPEGIILVTGPTGSGKTTTLYSLLGYINDITVNIMTLEDPVEYQLPLIRQSNVKEGSINFSRGIVSLMRQDPDIAFIGEVRDEETAMNAVRLALTGHQVYTTLHTNDALGAIPRLNDIGVPPHMLSGSLIACVAQRLARKLCSKCKKPRKATPEECRILQVSPEDPPTVYEAVGCKECSNRGYKGRTALIEILRVDAGLDELVATGATRNTMKEYALNKGFIPMIDDGVTKVLEGVIDIEELVGNIDCTERL
ncbi:MAG: Flp pilus assembly complex ATPase component TadA [Rickettsiales bacterium]|nr:Flp pilus assembly complex ATPase component TadA [Rickettsiales bacterium]